MAAMEPWAPVADVSEERAVGVNIYGAHQLAHLRLERELSGFRGHLEAILRTNALRESLEVRTAERQEYLQAVLTERSQELDRRIFEPLRQRQQQAQGERVRLQVQVENEWAHKEMVEMRRQRSFGHYRCEVSKQRQESAEERLNRMGLAAARAEALQAERIADELRRQDELESRRAEHGMRLAHERARASEAKRRLDEDMNVKLQVHQQEEQSRLDDKAAGYAIKIDRVTRMEMRRDELMRDIERARDKAAQTRVHVEQLLREAAGARVEDAESLRARLEDLVASATSTISASSSFAGLPMGAPSRPPGRVASLTTPRTYRSPTEEFFSPGSRSPRAKPPAAPRTARPASASGIREPAREPLFAGDAHGRWPSAPRTVAAPASVRPRSANRTSAIRQASSPASCCGGASAPQTARRVQPQFELQPEHRRLLATPAKPGNFGDAQYQGSDAPTDAGSGSFYSSFGSTTGFTGGSPASSPLGRHATVPEVPPGFAAPAPKVGWPPAEKTPRLPADEYMGRSVSPASPRTPAAAWLVQAPQTPSAATFVAAPFAGSAGPVPPLAAAPASPTAAVPTLLTTSPAQALPFEAAPRSPRPSVPMPWPAAPMQAMLPASPAASAPFSWPASPSKVQFVRAMPQSPVRSSTPVSPHRARAVVGAGVADLVRRGSSVCSSPSAAQSPVSIAAAAIRSAAFAMRP